jgi:hypothetical protein
MNLLTRTVIEDLIRMDVKLSIMTLETHTEIEKDLDDIKPAEIVARITGVDYDTVSQLLFAVYHKELTISEAIDQLVKEKELVTL